MSVITVKHTATDDNQFALVYTKLWVKEANVHVLSNNAYYGDHSDQSAPLNTSKVLFFQNPFNVAELFFKNYTAGNNCQVVLVGITMTPQEMEEHGVS